MGEFLMAGLWYLEELRHMGRKQVKAIIEILFRDENDGIRTFLSRHCDTREEMAVLAKRLFGPDLGREEQDGAVSGNLLSQDFLGICLCLADGDVNLTLKQVAFAGRRFQKATNRHFGLDESRFGCMLRTLAFEELDASEDRESVRLGKLIPLILRYHDVHTKDSETYWFGRDWHDSDDDYGDLDIERWNGYTPEEYRSRVALKIKMREFFGGAAPPTPEEVRSFLAEHGMDEKFLRRNSRPEMSS